MKFIIITPVRDEAPYILTTLRCMVQQTLLPAEWIIVDDGSTDGTRAIIDSFVKDYEFIRHVFVPDRGFRKPAQGVIEAFYAGFEKIQSCDYDVIAKFDGDVEFPTSMVEQIANAFKDDPTLGITGAVRFERSTPDAVLKRVLIPAGFVGGPTKFYRKQCFEDIHGLVPRAGWDGVDIIRAQMVGWKTREIESLHIIHLKPTGTAKNEGLKRAFEKYGDVNYYMGGYFWYFLLRVLFRSVQAHSVSLAVYMIKGYMTSLLQRTERESKAFRHFLRRTQLQNVTYWIRLGLHLK